MAATNLREQKTIGFIGLGMMGSRMVGHLKATHRLIVFDADAKRTAEIAGATGATAASGLGDFEQADVVILMLPNSAVIDQLVMGTTQHLGLLTILQKGALIMDMSSATPANTIANAAQADQKGIGYVDAPVSGGPAGAESGKLAIMVGCDTEHFPLIEPLLNRLGTNVVRTGAVGSGHAVKALNNLLAATILQATGEVFAAGEKFGLDPAVMQKVISASSGGSFMSSVTWPKAVLGQTWDFGFSLALMTKDVGIGMSLVNDTGVDAPLCRDNEKIWVAANNAGYGSEDMTYVAKLARDQAGLG